MQEGLQLTVSIAYRALYGRPYMQTTIKQKKKKKFMIKLDSIRCQKTKPDTRNLKTTWQSTKI